MVCVCFADFDVASQELRYLGSEIMKKSSPAQALYDRAFELLARHKRWSPLVYRIPTFAASTNESNSTTSQLMSAPSSAAILETTTARISASIPFGRSLCDIIASYICEVSALLSCDHTACSTRTLTRFFFCCCCCCSVLWCCDTVWFSL